MNETASNLNWNDITGTARARFFSGYGLETCQVLVTDDGSVLPWDSVAESYTRCHSLSARSAKRIAAKVRREVAGRAVEVHS